MLLRFILLLVKIKLCLWTCDTWCSLRARHEKAPAILSLGQRVTATVHAHHTIRTSSKHQKWEHPVKREKKGVLKKLERLSNKFTANANGNIYLSPRLILLWPRINMSKYNIIFYSKQTKMFSNNRRKRTAGREQKFLTRSFPFQLVLVTPDLLNTI